MFLERVVNTNGIAELTTRAQALFAGFCAMTGSIRCLAERVAVFNLDTRTFGILVRVIFCAFFLKNVCAAQAGHEKLIRIHTLQNAGKIEFSIENLQSADITVTLDLDLDNLTADVPLPFTATIPAHQTSRALELVRKDPDKEWDWRYSYSCTWGNMDAVHDDSVTYELPYEPGKSHKISQGFHGKYSHFGCDEYAIDWKMPVGTPIRAARGGVVVGAKDDSNAGGPDKKFDWDANYVLIKHNDGTYGHYVHLKQGGNAVHVGDTVQTGELIGLSGNTGHSTGPHLHFSVFKARDGKGRQTIPVKFNTASQRAIVLREGKSYKAGARASQLASTESKPATAPQAIAVTPAPGG